MTRASGDTDHLTWCDQIFNYEEQDEIQRANEIYVDGKTLESVTKTDGGTVFTFKSNCFGCPNPKPEIYDEPEPEIRKRLTKIYTDEVENYEARRPRQVIASEATLALGLFSAMDIAALAFVPSPEPVIAASTIGLGLATLYRVTKWVDYRKKKLILEKDSTINGLFLEMSSVNDGFDGPKNQIDAFMEPQTLSYKDLRDREKLMSGKVHKFSLKSS